MMPAVPNADLLREIEKSKLSYCAFDIERHDYDAFMLTLPSDAEEGMIVRTPTWDHIPAPENVKLKSRAKSAAGLVKRRVSFPPFAHYQRRDGAWVEVGRSHWVGSLSNGHFSDNHGSPTNALARLWIDMVEGFGARGNYRGYSYVDEMKASGLLQLAQSGLQFDHGVSDQAFGYYWRLLNNAFLRILKLEKTAADIRDDLLEDAGMTPSLTRQMREAPEPKPVRGKPGRKSKKQTSSETVLTHGDEE